MTNEQIKKATIGANKDQAELVKRANLQEEIDREIDEKFVFKSEIFKEFYNKFVIEHPGGFVGLGEVEEPYDELNTKNPQEIVDFIRIFVKEEIKTFIHEKIKQTEDNYKKELLEILKEPSYIGVLDNNEQRRGYEKAHTELINLIKSND